jgi:putative zinc- or iron-chelating protein
MKAEALSEIYGKIPPVDCFCCGSCCRKFKPAFGIAEFIDFCANISQNYRENKFLEMPETPLVTKGCKFLGKDNSCLVWSRRPFACRIFGINVISEGKLVSDYSQRCSCHTRKNSNSSLMTLKDFNFLNKNMDQINQKYYSFSFPFWIRALSFDSWVSLYWSENLKNVHLKKIQAVLKKNTDLAFLDRIYPNESKVLQGFERLIQAQELFNNQCYAEALLEFSIFRNNNSDDYAIEESLFYCGVCLEKIGNRSQAEEVYREVSLKTVYRNPSLFSEAEMRLKCLTKPNA